VIYYVILALLGGVLAISNPKTPKRCKGERT